MLLLCKYYNTCIQSQLVYHHHHLHQPSLNYVTTINQYNTLYSKTSAYGSEWTGPRSLHNWSERTSRHGPTRIWSERTGIRSDIVFGWVFLIIQKLYYRYAHMNYILPLAIYGLKPSSQVAHIELIYQLSVVLLHYTTKMSYINYVYSNTLI